MTPVMRVEPRIRPSVEEIRTSLDLHKRWVRDSLGRRIIWTGYDLRGADLSRANLAVAELSYTDLTGANMVWADLKYAKLQWADLTGATTPDGRVWEDYIQDPLRGICDEPEARKRAIAAWGHKTWKGCPLNAAHGWERIQDCPTGKRIAVAAFIAFHDSGRLPNPNWRHR
jgi:hypothetical protein